MINFPFGHTVQFALVDITTVGGEQLTLDKSKLRSFRRSQSVPAAQGFPVGGTAMKELVLTVDEEHVGSYNLDNASVSAYIEDGSVEHTYGTYKVVGTTKQSGICTITMYDDLIAMDKEYVSELTYPTTLGAMAAEIANAHGLPAPTFDASGVVCSVAPSGYTERQVLGYIAQCGGDVAMMDNAGSLVFRAFGKGAFDPIGDLHVVDGLTSENYGTPVTVTGVKCTVDGEHVLTGAEGYVLTVSNPLISADNVAAVQALWEEKVVGLEVCSCSVQAVDDYRIECMDAIRILDSKGEYHNIYVTDITYDMQRETRIACTANEPGTQASRGRVAPVQQLQEAVKKQGTQITELEGYFERKIWKTDVEEAVAGIEVGGRNLLKNTDVFYTTTVDANQPIVQSFTAYSDLYESLIGKQLTVSIYADTTGEYMFYSGDGGDPNAYIVFMCIWVNSISGQSTTQGYGISGVSILGIDNRRVTATSEVITQPSGYDKLVSVQVMIQGYAKPAEEGVTWTIGRPKLEVGNVATDWTPAPEDTTAAIEDAESNAAADATAKADKALADAIADTDAKLVEYSKTTEMETAIKQSAEAIRSEASATYTTLAKFESATANLQQQIDGAIETFTGSDVPTLNNSPASDWTDDAEKDTHIGDLYVVNADGGDYAGFYYRFEKAGTTYQWTLLKDTEITKALQDAKEANEKAQAVADDLSANYSTTTEMNTAIEQSAEQVQLTARKEAEEMIADNVESVGKVSGTLITIEDATDAQLQDITIYGKSTQASTPTPDAPVDVVSVGDGGSFGITACGKNLFNDTPIASRTQGGVTYSPHEGGGTKIVGTTTQAYSQNSRGDYSELNVSPNTTIYAKMFTNIPTAYIMFRRYLSDGTNATAQFTVDNDARTITIESNCTEVGIFVVASASSETTVNGYVRLVVSATNDITEYVPYNGNTATITENLPLRGIPVSSGGNYTDSSGQQWICDTLEKCADGSGKYIKRTRYMEYNGASSEAWSSLNGYFRIAVTGLNANKEGLCTICPVATSFPSNGAMYNSAFVYFRYNTLEVNSTSMTVADFKTWLAEHPMQLVAILAEPIETELTTEQVAELEKLYSFKPATNVFNGDGADMAVCYVRDTPLQDLQKRVSKAEASLTVQSGQIGAKVDKDGVIGAINLTHEEATIDAKRINLKGAVTADMMAVDSLSAINANLGTVTSGRVQSADYIEGEKGTVLDLDNSRIYSKSDTQATVYLGNYTGYTVGDDGTVHWKSISGAAVIYPEIEITNGELRINETRYETSGISYGDRRVLDLTSDGGIYSPVMTTGTMKCTDSVIATTARATNVICKNLTVCGEAFDLTVAASTTTTLYDFSDAETGIYEIMVWNGNATALYAIACVSAAQVKLSTTTVSTTISTSLGQPGSHVITLVNGVASEQTFSCRIVKKS